MKSDTNHHSKPAPEALPSFPDLEEELEDKLPGPVSWDLVLPEIQTQLDALWVQRNYLLARTEGLELKITELLKPYCTV